MSTRSIIARAESDGWVGVYHHSDGYPTGVGCCLYRGLTGKTDAEIEALFDEMLSHHAGWSWMLDWDTQPTGIDLANGRCYCHWKGREETIDNTRRASDPAAMREEYLYVYAPLIRTLFVYDTHYDHDLLIATVPIDGPEPDWAYIEDEGRIRVEQYREGRIEKGEPAWA